MARGAGLSVAPNQLGDAKGGDAANYNENDTCIFAYGFHTTCGRRTANEDRVVVVPCVNGNSRHNLYGVFDGHGGDKAAEFCSTEIPRLVRDAVLQRGGELSELDALDVFHDAFLQADKQLAENGVLDQGTTACTVFVSGDVIYTASTGDSQAVLSRAGMPVMLHQVHKVSDARERKRITASGGSIETVNGVERVNGILNMSRSLGDQTFKSAGIICDPSVNTRQVMDTATRCFTHAVREATTYNIPDMMMNARSQRATTF